MYFNCEVLPLLKGVSEVNPTVNLLVGLLNPPNKEECQKFGLIGTGATAASTSATAAKASVHNASFKNLQPMRLYPKTASSKAGSGSSHAHKAAAGKEPHGRPARAPAQWRAPPAAPGAAARPCRSALPRSATSS